MKIKKNTEVIYINIDDPTTYVQHCIVINIIANVNLTIKGHENINNDSININESNSTHTCDNNNINIIEVEIPEKDVNNYKCLYKK